jgi:hypothetical protein
VDAKPLVVALKRQVAIVRTLADEVERFLTSDSVAQELQVQLVDELTQLASRALEAARAWTGDGGGVGDTAEARAAKVGDRSRLLP